MDTVAPLLPLLADRLEPLRHLCNRYGVDRLWGSPDFVDTDQGVTGVSVRAAMNCCS